MTSQATGSFDVKVNPLPAYDTSAGSPLARFSIDKQFSGDLTATSIGEMLASGTAANGSGVYVAVERVTGTLAGRIWFVRSSSHRHHESRRARR